MAFPDNNDPLRNTSDNRRVSRTTVWAIAGAVVLVLFGLLFIFPGRNTHQKSSENPPNAVTQSQPQSKR
jgi:hypothetical protein